jgi:hexokinase
MLNLSMPLGEIIRNEMRNVNTKWHEFNMHRNEYTNLYLFSFSKFCTLEEQELKRFDYMKDVVLDEGIPTKFTLYF